MILYDTMWLNSPVPTWDASIRKGPVLSAAPGKLQSSRPRRDHFWCLKKQYTHTHISGFPEMGVPETWMVYVMENPIVRNG